ncbi:MAG TPA: YdeI/OmpD-associated family protein [Anaerolineaceae bacterium]|nr:YdeI/OmpD-associated family protein [Anaerolineaceae bacterium]
MKKELKNPGVIEFSTVIISEGVGAHVEFPYDTQELFGTMGRIPVNVEFDGQPYKGTMLRYGTEKHIIIIVKKIMEAIGKQATDLVQVKVELDDQPRIVELPDDVKQRLESDKSALEKFNALSYTKQKEYVDAINNAKRDETRQNRIDKLLQELK